MAGFENMELDLVRKDLIRDLVILGLKKEGLNFQLALGGVGLIRSDEFILKFSPEEKLGLTWDNYDNVLKNFFKEAYGYKYLTHETSKISESLGNWKFEGWFYRRVVE